MQRFFPRGYAEIFFSSKDFTESQKLRKIWVLLKRSLSVTEDIKVGPSITFTSENDNRFDSRNSIMKIF